MPILTIEERRGTVVGGRFELGDALACGGMGVVFAARELESGEQIVVKLPRTELSASQTRALRLSLEGEVLRGLRHPNIVRVLATGQTEDGVPFVALEYLQGRSLAEELRERGRVSWEEAVCWLLPVAGALAFAHRHGVIHRDLKPGNIFLARNAAGLVVPKLLDFGAAKSAQGGSITQTGAAIGTREYMAPEQTYEGCRAAPALDTWALAAVLHCCSTGQPPRHDRALDRRQLDAAAGPWLAQAIARALQRDPAQRFASMEVFARALAEAGWQQALSLHNDPDPLGLPGFPQWREQWEQTSTAPIPARPEPRRNRGRLHLGAAAVLAGFALLIAPRTGDGESARSGAVPALPVSKSPRTPVPRRAASAPRPQADDVPAATVAHPEPSATPAPSRRPPRKRSRKPKATPRPPAPPAPRSISKPDTSPAPEISRGAAALRRDFGPVPQLKRRWE